MVVAFDLVDNCLELAFIDFINNVTNKINESLCIISTSANFKNKNYFGQPQKTIYFQSGPHETFFQFKPAGTLTVLFLLEQL